MGVFQWEQTYALTVEKQLCRTDAFCVKQNHIRFQPAEAVAQTCAAAQGCTFFF